MRTFLKTVYLILVISHWSKGSIAQEIPIGNWRIHNSYNKIVALADGVDKIYAAAPNGIMALDKSDLSLRSIAKLEGLSSSGISALAFDNSNNQLFVAYEDGDLDILKGNEIINYNRLKNSSVITGSKKINHILIYEPYAYFSTDYGVVVFDLDQLEVKETWRDLSSSGTNLMIYQSVIHNDSIYLATEKGILAGSMDDNLLDFNQWQRFDAGDFNATIRSVANFNNSIYCAINTKGIYQLKASMWNLQSYLSASQYTSLVTGSQLLYVIANDSVWSINMADQVIAVSSDLITTPLAILESDEKVYIGDSQRSLISNLTNTFESFKVSGPSKHVITKLHFSDKLYAVAGGYSSSFVPLNNSGDVNIFTNGLWTSSQYEINDLTDSQISGGKQFYSSFGDGLLQVENSVETLFNETNSPLLNQSGIYVTTIENSSAGLWVLNYGASTPLHLLKGDNSWQSFTPSFTSSRYALDLAVDFSGKIWMVVNPIHGGGIVVFDKTNNQSRFLTDDLGTGGLPNQAVRSIAIDRDGLIWVGTDEGAAYFYTSTQDAIRPIFGSSYLLRDEDVTAIEVDGGNRKWMGTERGVWLFNPTGEQLIHNFNAANSPLPSDVILDIEINHATGEVFIATDKGVASFRADATASDFTFNQVKVFPNPVTSDFPGLVGISGLATDAVVKITDVSGKLVRQTMANGGTASWDMRDHQGRKVPTGMYLLFMATQDGIESFVGKIAVIN
ncbi:MAG: hypothetical protein L0Y35_07855 [Flammeovirgaceae bacterium]|nr:hypothetical protein [Flammeovirgaceae bacterium]